MSTQELIETTRELFKEHKSTLTLRELVDIQQELFKINILALVGIRQNTGYLTAETFIYNPEKSTVGKPHYDKVFSPFGFDSFKEALTKSIEQGLDNFSITQPKT